MRFDKEGNHGYKFYAHPNDAAKFGPTTPEQEKELEEVIAGVLQAALIKNGA